MSELSNEFPQPDNSKIDAWRYLDTAKFILLLLSQELPLIRIDRFDDKLEGLYTRKLDNEVARLGAEIGSPDSAVKSIVDSMHNSAAEYRRFAFASCWCLLNHESEAMWRIYCKAGDGVAIVLPYNRLYESFRETPKTYVGAVQYIDFENELIRQANPAKRAFYKRQEFEYEHEARVLHYDPSLRNQQDPQPEAIFIPWDAAEFVEKIVISPYAPTWYSQSIREFVRQVSPGLADRIERSSM